MALQDCSVMGLARAREPLKYNAHSLCRILSCLISVLKSTAPICARAHGGQTTQAYDTPRPLSIVEQRAAQHVS